MSQAYELFKKIDKRDRIILQTLELDARISEKALAQLCHLSKDSIRYRINRLRTANIITGYSCMIDYTKIGATSYKTYIQLQGEGTQLAHLRNHLNTTPAVFCRFEAQAEWNVAVSTFFRTLVDYDKFEGELLTKFPGISDTTLCHMVEARIFSTPFAFAQRTSIPLMGEIMPNRLDALDHKILTALIKDGRMPLLHIARDAKTSPDTIKQRITTLQHRNIIRAFTTSINYPALGIDAYKAFIYTRGMTAQEELQLIAWLSEQQQLRNWIRLAGPWKIEAEFLCESHEQLYELISKMRQAHPKVSRVSYAIFKNEIYYPSGDVLKYDEQ